MLLFAACLLGLSPNINAQTLPNMDFENWQRSSSNKYDEPTGGVWATPNPSLDFGLGNNPAPVEKETAAANVQNGSTAARLTTRSIFGIKAAGTIFAGKFVFNLGNPTQSAKLGVPFTGRPTNFRGYYKYTPTNGDSALVYARLIKLVGGQRTQIGIARQVIQGTVANYTAFDIPFTYQSAAAPDSIIIVYTSSAAADNLNAPQVGSVLWVDNSSLDYLGTSLNLDRMVAVQTFPNPATNLLNLRLSAPLKAAADLQFWSLDGKLVAQKPLQTGADEISVEVADLPQGAYLYHIVEKTNTVIAIGKVEIMR
jgi:Putative carbohydrate metabolism domain/Secretion system C-terminal sorting domain